MTQQHTGPFGGFGPPSGGGAGSSLDNPRTEIVVSATDSRNKVGADYVCTGTNDDVTISAAIEAGVSAGNSQAAKVILRCGTYTISNPILIDRDWITLEGETLAPFWNVFNGSTPTHST